MPKRYKRELFETEVDGCMFSLQDYDGRPLRKTWWILRTDADFHKRFNKSCDGKRAHVEERLWTEATKEIMESSTYPGKFVRLVANHWGRQWQTEQTGSKLYE